MVREKARMAIYSLAGIYLFSLVYQMIKDIQTAGSERIAMIIFILVFIVTGTTLIGMSIRYTYKNTKKQAEINKNNQ